MMQGGTSLDPVSHHNPPAFEVVQSMIKEFEASLHNPNYQPLINGGEVITNVRMGLVSSSGSNSSELRSQVIELENRGETRELVNFQSSEKAGSREKESFDWTTVSRRNRQSPRKIIETNGISTEQVQEHEAAATNGTGSPTRSMSWQALVKMLS